MTNCGRCSVEVASDWGPHACLLPDVWTLFPGTIHEVVCVESLSRAAIERESRKHSVSLEPVDYDETLCALLVATKVSIDKFDGRPGIIFRPWLFQRLGWAALDHWRSPAGFGRHGQHRVAGLPPALDDGDAGGDRREFAVGDLSADPAGRAAALGGLVAERDREPDGPVGIVGDAAGRGAEGSAAGGDGAAGAVAAGARGRVAPPYVDCEACGWRTYLAAPNGVSRWHVPDWCSGCGAAIGLQGAEAAA